MDKRTKQEIDKMHLLMERMDKHYTSFQAEALMEEIEELDARDREDMLPSEFFNMADNIQGGIKSTIGYVSSANLNIPQVKRLNPDTNRMKNFDDWDSFGKSLNVSDKISGVIKFSRYTFNWRGKESMGKHYENDYVAPVNDIRSRYGIAPISNQHQQQQPTALSTLNTPKQGSVLGPGFFMQDTGGKDCHKVVQYFLIGEDGKIIKYQGTTDGDIPADKLKNFFKKYLPAGISDLRKMNASDETIKAYSEELAKIPFKYTRFNVGSVAYVITTINGVKKRFFNPNLSEEIKGLKIDPQEYISLAKKLYKIDDSAI